MSWFASHREFGRTASAILRSLSRQLGVPGKTDRSPQPARLATLRIGSGSSAAIVRGSYQQIGESTTGIPRALATRASSSPSRDIPKR